MSAETDLNIREHKFNVIAGDNINEIHYYSCTYTDDSDYNASIAEYMNNMKDADGNPILEDTGVYREIT